VSWRALSRENDAALGGLGEISQRDDVTEYFAVATIGGFHAEDREATWTRWSTFRRFSNQAPGRDRSVERAVYTRATAVLHFHLGTDPASVFFMFPGAQRPFPRTRRWQKKRTVSW
jgi:hypothetical protein